MRKLKIFDTVAYRLAYCASAWAQDPLVYVAMMERRGVVLRLHEDTAIVAWWPGETEVINQDKLARVYL